MDTNTPKGCQAHQAHRDTRYNITAQISAIVFLLTLIWGGGTTYQRLVSLETWKDNLSNHIVTDKDLRSHTVEERAKTDQQVKDLEHQVRVERQFSRSLCNQLRTLQDKLSLPASTDCRRTTE